MLCGKPLSGTGKKAWPGSVDKAVAMVEAQGYVPGKSCRSIQKAGGKLYFYGTGTESGEAGEDCWRLEAI